MKRRLLFLLPAGVGSALLFWKFFQTDLTFFAWLLPPLFLGFVIQAVVLWLTRKGHKSLRFVPLILTLIPLAWALNTAIEQKGMFWILGVILYVELALLYVMGWGAAWGLEVKRHE